MSGIEKVSTLEERIIDYNRYLHKEVIIGRYSVGLPGCIFFGQMSKNIDLFLDSWYNTTGKSKNNALFLEHCKEG